MISQQNNPSPTLQPVKKMNVNIANNICENFFSLLLKQQLKIGGTWKVQETISFAGHY